jgi:cholesterol transport system auxiliary component
MTGRSHVWIMAALAALVAGCMSTAREYVSKRQYVIEAPRPDKALTAPDGAPSLKVRHFRVSEPFDSALFITRTGTVMYESDFYNKFLASPGVLMAETTRQWLAAAGVFSHVAPATSRASARYLLEGNVVALYGDYQDRAKPTSVIEVQFFLIDTSSGENVVVFNKTYRQETSAAAARAPELAEAFNAGLGAILAKLEADLRRESF